MSRMLVSHVVWKSQKPAGDRWLVSGPEKVDELIALLCREFPDIYGTDGKEGFVWTPIEENHVTSKRQTWVLSPVVEVPAAEANARVASLERELQELKHNLGSLQRIAAEVSGGVTMPAAILFLGRVREAIREVDQE